MLETTAGFAEQPIRCCVIFLHIYDFIMVKMYISQLYKCQNVLLLIIIEVLLLLSILLLLILLFYYFFIYHTFCLFKKIAIKAIFQLKQSIRNSKRMCNKEREGPRSSIYQLH